MKIIVLFFTLLPFSISAQNWVTPVIEGYGQLIYSKDAAVQPEKDLDYKLIYKIASAEERNGVNKGLNSIAHSLNMFGASAISPEKIQIVSSISGPATSIILTDKAYRVKYGKDNPNTKIIDLLANNGVKFYVCS